MRHGNQDEARAKGYPVPATKATYDIAPMACHADAQLLISSARKMAVSPDASRESHILYPTSGIYFLPLATWSLDQGSQVINTKSPAA